MTRTEFAQAMAADIRRLVELDLLKVTQCRILPVVPILAALEAGDLDRVERLIGQCAGFAATAMRGGEPCLNALTPQMCLCRRTAEFFRRQMEAAPAPAAGRRRPSPPPPPT